VQNIRFSIRIKQKQIRIKCVPLLTMEALVDGTRTRTGRGSEVGTATKEREREREVLVGRLGKDTHQ